MEMRDSSLFYSLYNYIINHASHNIISNYPPLLQVNIKNLRSYHDGEMKKCFGLISRGNLANCLYFYVCFFITVHITLNTTFPGNKSIFVSRHDFIILNKTVDVPICTGNNYYSFKSIYTRSSYWLSRQLYCSFNV